MASPAKNKNNNNNKNNKNNNKRKDAPMNTQIVTQTKKKLKTPVPSQQTSSSSSKSTPNIKPKKFAEQKLSVTATKVMSLVSMAKPQLRDAHDAVVFALHAYMVRHMFTCRGLNEKGSSTDGVYICVGGVCVYV